MCTDANEFCFVWADYLEDTNSVEAPPTAFSHVEYSIESLIKVGMALEIPVTDSGEKTYWLATVRTYCGDLLSLRYAGYKDDPSADFWFMIKSSEFHPVGWCAANNQKMWPPKGVLEKCEDVDALLQQELSYVQSIPESLSESLDIGITPIQEIKCGMKLEITDDTNPEHVWIVTVTQNVGGRLKLSYDVPQDTASHEFWLFYLSERLYSVGYATENNLRYHPPKVFKQELTEEWKSTLDNSLKEVQKLPFPDHVLERRIFPGEHYFKEGMKLEAIDNRTFINICPATVTKVINDYYFIVEIDDFLEDSDRYELCCHSNSPFIFPVGWAPENGLQITVPKGYACEIFSWNEYLRFCNSESAPGEFFLMCCPNMGFGARMKLEAVDPFFPDKIRATTIVKIVKHLMWLHFDDEECEEKCIISSIDSLDVYPVGWCDSNFYPLQIPRVYRPKPKLKTLNTVTSHKAANGTKPEQQTKLWCPAIHFNHLCYTGPFLNKKKLANLPKTIGPGSLPLVMRHVISRIVNVAYNSIKVLQRLEVKGQSSPFMQQHIIKAKYKGKYYESAVEVVTNSEEAKEFCKKICKILECCTCLFGPESFEACPDNCQTEMKPKFGPYVSKNKTGETSDPLDNDPSKKGPGRRKKKRHWTQILAAAESSTTGSGEQKDSEFKPKSCERSASDPSKKKLKITTASSIVTRGAKPNFGQWHHMSMFHFHRGAQKTRKIGTLTYTGKKVGRPVGSTKKAMAIKAGQQRKLREHPKVIEISDSSDEKTDDDVIEVPVQEEKPCLPEPSIKSDPRLWSVEDVSEYIKQTECAPLAPLLRREDIDGQALMMLNKRKIQEFLHLKPEPTEKFCHLIKNVILDFQKYYIRK